MVNSNYSSLGKPAIAGAVSVAPVGTALPTDAKSELPEAWTCLGYISDSGLTNSNSPSSTAIKAWGGDELIRYVEDMEDTFQFNLVEVLNAEVLKLIYGEENVTGTLESGIKIAAGDQIREAHAWVIDIIMNNALKRVAIPSAAITSMSDITYADTSIVGYDITITAKKDSDAKTHYEYIIAD
jgi:hypothetical protein